MNERIQVNLRGEIVSASNFNGNSFFLSYCFLLPEGWICGDDKQLSGVTHITTLSSRTEADRTFAVAHFNHLFDLPLWATPGTGGSVELVMEMSSLDSWERLRSEGYAAAALSLAPGHQNLTIPMWIPLPDLANHHATRIADMRKFFIGGNPQLRDLGCHLAQSQTPPILSRAGLRAESSGEIQIKTECALQRSQASVLPSGSQRNTHNKHLVSSVDQVILAYTKVQARMSRVRQAMKLELEGKRE